MDIQPDQNGMPAPPVKKTNALCLTSFILAIVCFLTGWLMLPLLGTIGALIFGIMGVCAVKKTGESGKLLGIWGIIISSLTLLLYIAQVLFSPIIC